MTNLFNIGRRRVANGQADSTGSRMNLFRELISPAAASKRAPLPFQFKFCAAVLAVAFLILGNNWFQFQKFSKSATKMVSDLNHQVETMAEEKEREIASRPKATAPVAVEPIRHEEGEDSWTSLMWKIASQTGVGIALERLDLSNSGAAPAANVSPNTPAPASVLTIPSREVTIEGEAKSIREITQWLEDLSQRIPGFSFVLEHQMTSSDKDYPVGFKIVARAS